MTIAEQPGSRSSFISSHPRICRIAFIRSHFPELARAGPACMRPTNIVKEVGAESQSLQLNSSTTSWTRVRSRINSPVMAASDNSTPTRSEPSPSHDEKTADEPAGRRERASTNPAMARLHLWQIQAIRDVLLVGAVVGLVWIGYVLRTVTVPLLVALLLAYLVGPLIEWLCRRWRIRRPIAVSALLATGGVLVLAALAVVLPILIQQTIQFIDYIQSGELSSEISQFAAEHVPESYQEHLNRVIDMLPGKAGTGLGSLSLVSDATQSEQLGNHAGEPQERGGAATTRSTITEDEIAQMIDRRLEVYLLQRNDVGADEAQDQDRATYLLDIAMGTVNAILGVMGGIVRLGLLAFLIPFYFFFFCLWYPDVIEFSGGLMPERNRGHTIELLSKMDRVVAGFVRGRIVISLIMGALLAFGWWLCAVPYAIMLGLMVAVFCAVPYLGIIGIPIAVGLLFFHKFGLEETDADYMVWWAIILWPTLVFVIVQMIEGYVLTPMIAGKVTNLDPVTIIVTVLAGGSVLGVYGMLLAIPLAACGKILVTEMLLPNVRAWTRGEIADPLPIPIERE